MKSIYFIVFTIFIFDGCEKIFMPKIDQVAPSIVVEGLITTRPSLNRIYVNTTRAFGGPLYGKPVSGLTVYVIDNNQNRINFYEIENTGTYITNLDETSTAKVGNIYILFIETPDSLIYKSSPQTVKECPEISNIYIKFEVEKFLTVDAYGSPLEMSYPGFSIFNNTKAILPEENFFLYRWYGYEEFMTTFAPKPPGLIFYVTYRHRQLDKQYTEIICTGNADVYNNKILEGNKIVFIPKLHFQNYETPVPEGDTIVNKAFQGLLFACEQYSISKDAYNFWEVAKDQLNADSKIFDPISAQIKGNMVCVNNSNKSVFGVYCASDVKIRYDYLYISSNNSLYSQQIDTMPELWLDTCSYTVPNGWIVPKSK